MSECGVCGKSVGSRSLKIACSECRSWCHAQCVNMSKDDIEAVADDSLVWRCPPCSKVRRKSMAAVSAAESGTAKLEDVIFMLQGAQEERKRIETDLGASIEFGHKQIEENTRIIKEQSEKIEKCLGKIDDLTNENLALKRDMKILKNRLEDCEQYTRANALEIQGIPAEPNEDIFEVVKKVGAALDVEVDERMIDVCHRLGKRPGAERPPGIIVRFVRRVDKQLLLQKRRVKRTLSTRHLGMPMDVPVYLNECLSPARRSLFMAARDIKTRKGYKYLWVRDGKIFLRKEENEKVFVVTTVEDLETL